jgi:hypothetical protein
MRKQIQMPKVQAEQAKHPMPMRRLDDKEVGQVVGGPMGAPTLTPKKP